MLPSEELYEGHIEMYDTDRLKQKFKRAKRKARDKGWNEAIEHAAFIADYYDDHQVGRHIRDLKR